MAEFPSFEEWLRQRGISRYAPGPAPGYQPRAVVEYGGVSQAPVDNYVWRVQAADVIANNVLYNPSAAGRPGGWDDAKYGSWDELVKRNQGRDKMYDGDYQKIFNYITDKYGNAPPPPGSYLERTVGAWVAPTGQEFVLSREEEMRLLGEYRYDRELALEEEQFEWQRQAWMMNYELEKERMAQEAAYRQQSLALEGRRLDLQERQMKQQYQLALSELAQERELKMLELSQDRELTLARLEMDWRVAVLQTNTQLTIAEKQLAFEREKWEAQKALERAKVITQLTANPSDVIAREYFIRTGYEPIGNLVNVFTGLPEGMGTLTGAQTLNAYQIPSGAYIGTPGTLVLPPPPVGEPTGATGPATTPPPPDTTPPAPPPPSMAHGGYTNAPVFVVGDSADGNETGYEEIVINPTRAPVAVVPLSKLVGRKS